MTDVEFGSEKVRRTEAAETTLRKGSTEQSDVIIRFRHEPPTIVNIRSVIQPIGTEIT